MESPTQTRLPSMLIGAQILTLLASPVLAAPLSWGVTGGTGGVGADVTYERAFGVAPIDLRLGVEALSVSRNITYDAIAYSGKLKLGDVGAYVDLHPFGSGNGFVVTGGYQASQRKATIVATPATNVVIGGRSFTPAQVGTLNGEVQLSKANPYAGIGYRLHLTSHVRVKFDLGAAFGTAPQTHLTASNAQVPASYLATEQTTISNAAKDFKLYPLATVGLALRF